MTNTDKYLAETFKYITQNSQTQKFKVKVGRIKNHPYNNRELTFSKINDYYSFSITTIITKEIQTDKELEINRETEVQISNDERIFFTKGKYVIPSNISYPHFDNPSIDNSSLQRLIEGSINSISTKKFSYYIKERRYRIILPLNREVRLRGSFTGWHLTVDGKAKSDTLIKLTINGKELHFYHTIPAIKKITS